jgi:glycosyltransferase involved in cell wall biosynthesis
VAVGGQPARLPDCDDAAGRHHAQRLQQRRPDVGGGAHRGEDRKKSHERAAGVGDRQSRHVGTLDPHAGRPRRGCLRAFGEELHAEEPLGGNALAQHALEPPTGPAPRVEQHSFTADRVRREFQNRSQELLANRRVSPVVSVPRVALAGIGTVARMDPRDPVVLASVYFPLVRVLFLTHYYPPELGAAPARIAALARGLADRGLEVSVHTGFPHYPSGTIPAPYRNRRLRLEREGPVRVLRSVVYPVPNRGFARRLANHTVFAAGALTTAHAAGGIDVVVAETPPLFTAAAGVAYARVKGARLILNVSDLWPESAIELGALSDPRTAAAAHAVARLCYRRATLITAPTKGIVDSLDSREEAIGRVIHIPPAVDLERFASVRETPPRANAPLRVLYAGTLGMSQEVRTLVRAAALAGPEVVELTIAGEGPEALSIRSELEALGIPNVSMLGGVSSERIPSLYESADAGIVPLRDRPVFGGALPTKLFEVLAAGKPVIVAARGEAAELVLGAGAGLVVAPEEPRGLASAFGRLKASPQEALAMGRRGRAKAREFDRAAAVDRWQDLLTVTPWARSR